MAAFNVVKLDVDGARGIIEPKTNAERTPTPDAIEMRFRSSPVGRCRGLSSSRSRYAHLTSARCGWGCCAAMTRAYLTDVLVAHALQRVAHERGAATVARHEYAGPTGARPGDRDLHGDDGLLQEVLPTDNQMLVYCDASWVTALKLAGLKTTAKRNPP